MCPTPNAANLDLRSTLNVATCNVLMLKATGHVTGSQHLCASWNNARSHSQASLKNVSLVVVLYWWSRYVCFTLGGDHHVNGIALIVRRPFSYFLKSWQGISERLFLARFVHIHGHITVVVAYAPTEDSNRRD